MSTPPGDPEGPVTRPGEGLWSGVIRRWGRAVPDASKPVPAAPEAADSREALQGKIERQRRNDLARRREFEFLRQRRLRERGDGERAGASSSSLFHSSICASRDERATTLRKIDEIEAQMSDQWRRFNARPVTRSEAAIPVPRTAGPCMAQVGASGADAFFHDPELEEAALRFAQGDMEGARAAILSLLAPGHPRATHPETWQVLFDFYRATGQQDHYEACAVDFATRLGCSPPAWRRLSDPPADGSGVPDSIASAFPACGASEEPPDWICPAVLDRMAVAALQALLPALAQPWCLSWSGVSRIGPDALQDLAALVAQWVTQPLKIRFVGAERLERAIEARTVPGDREVPAAWWILRMDLLRALRHCEAFEQVALDYCITYEVSPPSWEPPRCEIRLLADETAVDNDTSWLTGGDATGLRGSALADGDLSSLFETHAAIELSGQVVGDASAVLARIDGRVGRADSVVIACGRLERIDFEAAGALLNWVAARQAQGQTVHLTDLHRLVAVFLGSMGLDAQARLTLRRD